jgi:hypothetical protein
LRSYRPVESLLFLMPSSSPAALHPAPGASGKSQQKNPLASLLALPMLTHPVVAYEREARPIM